MKIKNAYSRQGVARLGKAGPGKARLKSNKRRM